MSADEPRFYWEGWLDGERTDPVPFGRATARIIDLEAGGVIAYCHASNAHRIVMALRSATTKDD